MQYLSTEMGLLNMKLSFFPVNNFCNFLKGAVVDMPMQKNAYVPSVWGSSHRNVKFWTSVCTSLQTSVPSIWYFHATD